MTLRYTATTTAAAKAIAADERDLTCDLRVRQADERQQGRQ